MKTIALLTSKAGAGHESIARAVKQALKDRFRVDVYDSLPMLMVKLYSYIHLYLPTFYNFSYKLTNNNLLIKTFRFFYFLFVLPVLKKIPFADYDLIFSVQPIQPFLTSKITWLIKKQKIAVLINDPFSPHQIWICPQADLTFVPTLQVKDFCLQHGLAEEKIIVSGFPIRQQFFKKLPKKETIRQKLGLNPNKFTILLGGSGYGVRETREIARCLKNEDIQVLVVCGRNKTLQSSLSKKKNIKVFGYVENMAKVMKACDLIVSKAGPSLLFESIISGIPFLATGYPPEQEKGNLEFIKKAGVGWVEKNPKKAIQLIKKLAKNPQKLAKLKPNLQKLAKNHQNAPQIIASHITHLLINSTTAKAR